MWKLTIEDDEGKRTPLPLFRDEYTVGRSEENTIRLTERNISRQHALLRRAGLGWALIDYRSRNGSFINGVRVNAEAQLQHGDVVQLGDYRIEVIDESLVEQSSGSTDSAMAATKPDRLVVVAGPSPGQEFVICAPTMLIGRAAEVDVSIPHISVSRVHAEVHALGNGRYEVIDKGSANGVRVNGSLLGRALIEAGDYIELGEVRLKFVGAGQVYWPGAEATRLSVEAPEISTMRPPAAPSWGPPRAMRVDEPSLRGGSSLAKNFAIGAVGAVLAVGAMFAYQRFRVGYPKPVPLRPEPASPQAPSTRTMIDEAKELARAGLLDAAHDRITKELARDPMQRDLPDVRDVERRWAESVLSKAEQESDLAARRSLLNTIAQDPFVDGELRRSVADKLRDLDERGKDTRDLPHAARPASASGRSSDPAGTRATRDAVLAPDPWAPESASSAVRSSPSQGTDSGRSVGDSGRRARKVPPLD